MTSYTVLKRDTRQEPHDDTWVVVGSADATSSQAALRRVLALNNGGADGTYVAIPDRSFQPVTVKVETPAPRLTITK